MCGIIGTYGWADEDILSQMLDCIAHRGPDGVGTAIGDDVMLGARRLSIVDLTRGDQPMSNEDGTVTVVFNGEIYNHDELREDLRERGHKFASRCDTEVLVHLWEEYGREMVQRLSGMFAFSIWDRNENSVFLARDRLGIKPLYYATTNDGLVWGSEVQPLLEAGVDRTIDERAVHQFFTFKYTPWSQTLLSDVKKLEPGTWLSIDEDGIERGRYWTLQSETVSGGVESIISTVRSLLEQSVKDRMMADVPVGAFLSGGLDSSAIVGLATDHIDDLNTYSIAFKQSQHDERSEASFVADYFETTHHEIEVDLASMDMFETVIERFGEPLANATALPSYLMAETASNDVKVALSGTGADELFAGYHHLNTLPKQRNRYNSSPPLLYLFASRIGDSNLIPESLQNYATAFAALESDEKAYLNGWPGDAGTICRLLETDITHEEIKNRLAEAFSTTDASDTLGKYTSFDITQYLQNDLLYKTDQTTMAASIEGRVPFLDHKLVEFSYAIPKKYKLNGNYKPILRKAVSDVLPQRTKQRSKKHFSVPIKSWLQRDDLPAINRWLIEDKLKLTPFINDRDVIDIWSEHQKQQEDHTSELWRVINYVAWYHTIVCK